MQICSKTTRTHLRLFLSMKTHMHADPFALLSSKTKPSPSTIFHLSSTLSPSMSVSVSFSLCHSYFPLSKSVSPPLLLGAPLLWGLCKQYWPLLRHSETLSLMPRKQGSVWPTDIPPKRTHLVLTWVKQTNKTKKDRMVQQERLSAWKSCYTHKSWSDSNSTIAESKPK